MNDFYNSTGYPAPKQKGDSSPARTEFSSIAAAFDKMPQLTGNGGKWWRTNAGGTGVEARTNAQLLADVGFGANISAFLQIPSSIKFRAALTDATGTGSVVFANSPTIIAPTLVNPALGAPTSGHLTNCTNLPVGTGISGLAPGVATFLAAPSSANLAAALTDESGTGLVPFMSSGTWTPSVGGTATYGIYNQGTWIRIGRIVFIQARLDVATMGTGGYGSTVIGLPFAPSSVANDGYPISIGSFTGLRISVSALFGVAVAGLGGSINFWELMSGGTSTLLGTIITNGTEIGFSGVYVTDAA